MVWLLTLDFALLHTSLCSCTNDILQNIVQKHNRSVLGSISYQVTS